jgi:murein DD-endopeptidase MepM/ murein hydrolase activator NlpD
MNNRPFLYRFVSLFLLLAVAACQETPQVISEPSQATAQPATLAPTVPPQSTIPGPGPTQAPATKASPPARTADPLRFNFPTPAPLPASRWRPPLYDVPWALSPYDHFYLTRPIAADEVNWPEWDYRYGGIAEGKELSHSGIDIAVGRYKPIIAAGPGTVSWTGYGLLNRDDDPNDPYGLAVVIDHDFGYNGHRVSTVYGHMERIDVTLGQRVVAGQEIGLIGITGNSTGPHLHFEVRLQFGDYGATRNPELWLAPPQGWGVLAARLMREDTTPLYQMAVYVQSKTTQQIWEVHTYGPTNLHFDDYYRENLVLSDLPAGDYELSFTYKDELKKYDITIRPGSVTFIVYRDKRGFSNPQPTPTPIATEWLVTPRSK